MSKLGRVFLVLLFIFSVTGRNVHAGEQDQKQVEDTIQQMQMRLMELEGQLNQMKQKGKNQELEGKVNNLEKKLGDYTKDDTFRAYWKDGLTFSTPDEKFKLKIFGRIHNDWVWQSANDETEYVYERRLGFSNAFQDGTRMRRGRIGMSGTIYDNVVFKAEWDWSDGEASWKDVYLGVEKIPYVGEILAGHLKEPFSLEEMGSSNSITFIERAIPNALVPSRNTGLRIENTAFNKHLHWSAGVFKETDNFGNSKDSTHTYSGDGDYTATARITGTPIYGDEGRELIHLGVAGSRRKYYDGVTRYRSRPPDNFTTYLVDTGTRDQYHDAVHFDKTYLLGAEAAFVYGPASLQGEWIWSANDRERTPVTDSHDHVDMRGWYAFASYFITGEHRPYDQKHAVFVAPKPKENLYDKKKGWGLGAWEVAFRYDKLDLEDDKVIGGEMHNLTYALNWYLNKNTRIMMNYIDTNLDRNFGRINYSGRSETFDDDDGEYDAFVTRFEIFW